MAQPITDTLQSAAAATGVGTSTALFGWRELAIQITGTFVGTVTFESTIDGTNWVATGMAAIATGTLATSATTTGLFYKPLGSFFKQFRANITAYTSGSITVTAVKQ